MTIGDMILSLAKYGHPTASYVALWWLVKDCKERGLAVEDMLIAPSQSFDDWFMAWCEAANPAAERFVRSAQFDVLLDSYPR